jgi:hypothetical protein
MFAQRYSITIPCAAAGFQLQSIFGTANLAFEFDWSGSCTGMRGEGEEEEEEEEGRREGGRRSRTGRRRRRVEAGEQEQKETGGRAPAGGRVGNSWLLHKFRRNGFKSACESHLPYRVPTTFYPRTRFLGRTAAPSSPAVAL